MLRFSALPCADVGASETVLVSVTLTPPNLGALEAGLFGLSNIRLPLLVLAAVFGVRCVLVTVFSFVVAGFLGILGFLADPLGATLWTVVLMGVFISAATRFAAGSVLAAVLSLAIFAGWGILAAA